MSDDEYYKPKLKFQKFNKKKFYPYKPQFIHTFRSGDHDRRFQFCNLKNNQF